MLSLSPLAHDWRLSASEAIHLQQRLRSQVDLSPIGKPVRTIAGADISYNKFSDVIYAGIVILDYETQQVIGHSTVIGTMTFPYIPGLLSFRELPALLLAWQALPAAPDVVMLDGQGIAHPRRLGVASHFGLVAGIPALGCGKTVLTGKFDDPAPTKGSYSPMLDKGEVVGYALRTKDKTAPVYISPGTGLTLDEARQIALHCARGYRIPEPTRQAHLLVNQLRRGEIE